MNNPQILANNSTLFQPNDPSISFRMNNSTLTKSVNLNKYNGTYSININPNNTHNEQPSILWEKYHLKKKRIRNIPIDKKKLRVCDIFCGAGGFSLGVQNALEQLGMSADFVIANDVSKDSIDVYNQNFQPKLPLCENISNLIKTNKDIMYRDVLLPDVEQASLIADLSPYIGNIDVLIGGPPCEGHSNLNNKTRRVDDRNNYYLTAALFGILLKSPIIIFENVITVRSSHQNILNRSKFLLSLSGYDVKNGEYVLHANDFGVAQTRKRHFLIAIKSDQLTNKVYYENLKSDPITVMDAIGDLVDTKSNNVMDQNSKLSSDNVQRINYLFDNNLYNLPDNQRPDCHRLKKHTYPSVYGRMFPDKPSGTISTGFQSPGRGRYIHPFERRGLTLREGARIQGFPDNFKWLSPILDISKASISRMIGDAVPPNLGTIATYIALEKCPKKF